MKNKSAQKIKLTSYDDLFGTDTTNAEQVTSVPISELHSFKNHPFRVLDDEKMQETVDSIKKYGVLMPGIVRPRSEGGYEVVAGHRRWRACKLAGLEEMPVLIRDMDDDTATVIMVDTNIQREDILPSEKAFAYKMKYLALKHQGSKGDKLTAVMVGEAAGESGRTVQRYIRLAELMQGLLEYVDLGKIAMVVGEKLSYLSLEEQTWLMGAIESCGVFPSKTQAEQMKESSSAGKLTEGIIYSILVKKERVRLNVTLPEKRIRSYFPAGYSVTEIEEVIYSLLDEWKLNKRGEDIDAGTPV